MSPRYTLLSLLLLALAAFSLRLSVIWPDPHPTGTDGYYYVVQVDDLVALGELHVPDGSWVLRFLALPRAAGLDPARSVALAACCLAALAVPAGYWLGSRRSELAGVLLALYAAASPTITHLAADFPKNLGAVPAGWALLALVSAPVGSPRTRAALGALALLLLSTAHRTGAAIAGLAAAGWAIGWLLAGLSASRRARILAAVGAVAALCAFFVLSALSPGLLHPSDLERVSSQLRANPWPPPPLSWLPLRRTDPAQLAELVIVPWLAWAVGLAAIVRRPEGRPALLALWLPLSVALNPLWRADSLDLAYRLSLLAPFLGAPILARLAPDLALRSAPARAALLVALLALPAARLGYDPASEPPYASYDRLFAAIPRPAPELLILPQGASFYWDHLTGGEALAWAPEPGLDRSRIFRVAFGLTDGQWAAYAPKDAPVRPIRLDYDHVYVREDVWEALVAKARAEGDDDLLARIADPRNPSRVRPAALLRARSP